ncbi:MAG: hypothetical protein H0W50_04740 [Parachlamydiaceae bacterium]|nr:hypothetical protein [Parachlamydiaceae bacterium]
MSPINTSLIYSSGPLNLPEISSPIPKFVEILDTHNEDKIMEFIKLYGINATSEKFYEEGYFKKLIHIYKREISEILFQKCIINNKHLFFDKLLPLLNDKNNDNLINYCT